MSVETATLADLRNAVRTAINRYGKYTRVYVDVYSVIRLVDGRQRDNFIDLNDMEKSPIR